MQGATVRSPAWIPSWVDGVAQSTSQVTHMTSAPWSIRSTAAAFVRAGSSRVFWTLNSSLRPSTPPAAFTCSAWICAAVRAGPSKNFMSFVWSTAAPIVIGPFSAVAPPPSSSSSPQPATARARSASSIVAIGASRVSLRSILRSSSLLCPSGARGFRRGRVLLGHSEARDHARGEQLLRFDRLPVLEAAGVRGDANLLQAVALLDHGLDALGDVVRRAHPDDVAVQHLVIWRGGELLHDPARVEGEARFLEHL